MIPELGLKHLENIVYYNKSKPEGVTEGVITLETNHTNFQLKKKKNKSLGSWKSYQK